MAISVNADAKLRFLRGLEANLPSTMTDGYVYVTTDTRAMYVDYTDADKKLARIRIGDVLTVANVAALPAIADAKDGVLYYCAAENILCTPGVVDGVRKWRQINEQKTLGNLINSMSFTASDNEAGAELSFMIIGSNNEIKNASTGFSNGANVKIVSNDLGNGVKIGAKDTTVTGAISAGSVTGGAEIKLTNTTGGTDADGTVLTGTAEGGSVQIVGNGVVVSQADNKITVDGALKSVTNAFDTDGKFTTTIVEATDDTVTAEAVTPTVRYGLAKDSGGNPVKTATFKSGNADLSVYTIAETDAAIESKLKAANAMTFKGTLGSSGATATELPTSAALGDTYIVAEKGTYYYKKTADAASNTAQSCQVGDMFIAGPGDEDTTTGNLLKLCWTYVPAGDDDIPEVSAQVSATEITFESKLGNNTSTIGTVKAGSGLKGSADGQVYTIAHDTITTAKPTSGTAVSQGKGKSATYTAITGVTINNGHVTGYETTDLTVVDTALDLDSTGLTATAGTGGANIGLNIKDTAGNTVDNSITIKASGNSAAYVSVDNGAIVLDTVWGTFE